LGGRINDPLNPKANWGLADYDRRHRLIVTYNWQLPSPWKTNAWAEHALGRWSVSGVTTVQSGLPLTVTDTRGGSIYGLTTASAYLCPGSSLSDAVTHGSDTARLGGWFNLAAFAGNPKSSCSASYPVSPFAAPGNAATGFGNLGRSTFEGPGQFNWDISLAKQIPLGGERRQLLFRTEFYNAFNHPQFSNPSLSAATPSTFGVIQSTSVAPRLIQFGLKYQF
jgi:hypothetical protein